MKIKQLFTSFLACMALWSVPVYGDLATDGFFPINKPLVNFSNYHVNEINVMRDKLNEATEAKGRRKKRHKAKKARTYMIHTLSDTRKFPKDLDLDQYIDKINNVKFGIKQSTTNKGIQTLNSILDDIETHLKLKKQQTKTPDNTQHKAA